MSSSSVKLKIRATLKSLERRSTRRKNSSCDFSPCKLETGDINYNMGKNNHELMLAGIAAFQRFFEENGIVDTTTCWWE